MSGTKTASQALLLIVGTVGSIALACEPIEAPDPDNDESANDARSIEQRLRAPVPQIDLGESVDFESIELIGKDGSPLSHGTLADKVVVLTFFETRSRDSALCPTLMRRLAHLQGSLRPDLWERVHLLSISVDPTFDTPEILRRYAEEIGADFRRWTLATAEDPALEPFAGALGVFYWKRADGTVGHTLNTVVIDRSGRLADGFPGSSQWSAEDLLASVVQVAER